MRVDRTSRSNMKLFMLAMVVICLFAFEVRSIRVIVYLANVASETSRSELMQSLRAIRVVFESYGRTYPLWITYDSKLERHVTAGLRGDIMEETANCSHPVEERHEPCVRLIPVKGWRRVPWPWSMYTDVYKDDNPYYASLGYRNMCRYWAFNIFGMPFMHNVSAYMKLDTDTIIRSMPVDPFRLLEDEQLDYIGPIMYQDGPRVVEGIWETFLRFAVEEGIHPRGLVPLSNGNKDGYSAEDISGMSLEQATGVLLRRGYNLMIFYCNWEVSNVNIWRSPVFGRLARFIDAAGGIILRRWGDCPIRTLSLYLLQEALGWKFRQYRGLVLYHKAWHSTAGTELLESVRARK